VGASRLRVKVTELLQCKQKLIHVTAHKFKSLCSKFLQYTVLMVHIFGEPLLPLILTASEAVYSSQMLVRIYQIATVRSQKTISFIC